MKLVELVLTSAEVAATRSRKRKNALLAARLGALAPDEVAAGVAFLCGELRQGKVGLGPAAVRAARPGGAREDAVLTVREVDDAFAAIQAESGPGSNKVRLARFEALLARATAEKQRFLTRLAIGELRQGALEGLVLEAIATAGGVDGARVRRAAMLSGDKLRVAVDALGGDPSRLDIYRLELFRPVVEVAFNDVQESPHYARGLALRFARLRRYRPDKSVADADTLDAVRRIHAGERRASRDQG